MKSNEVLLNINHKLLDIMQIKNKKKFEKQVNKLSEKERLELIMLMKETNKSITLAQELFDTINNNKSIHTHNDVVSAIELCNAWIQTQFFIDLMNKINLKEEDEEYEIKPHLYGNTKNKLLKHETLESEMDTMFS